MYLFMGDEYLLKIKKTWHKYFSFYQSRNEKQKTQLLILAYSFVFFIGMAAIFLPAFLQDKTLIYYHGDAYRQHYPMAVYFCQWIREVISNVFQGNFTMPMWDMNIGFGSDVMTTLHYYVFGDPLSLLYAFVKPEHASYMYSFIIILRYYLIGLSFIAYTREMKMKRFAALIGTFVYLFSSFSLYQGLYHPFFTNALLYLPLLLIGVEKINQNKRPYLLIVVTAISLFSNFYFFFMLTIFTFIYAMIRFLMNAEKRQVKLFFQKLTKTVLFYIAGVGIACILFVPVLLAFIGNGKTGIDYSHSMFFYPVYQYVQWFTDFFTLQPPNGTSMTLGFHPISFFTIAFLFLKRNKEIKEARVLKWAFILLSIGILSPMFGYVLSGFSYVSNRWSFAYAFLIAFTVSYALPQLLSLTRKEKTQIFKAAIVYSAISITLMFMSWRLTTIFGILTLFGVFAMLWFFVKADKDTKGKIKYQKMTILGGLVLLTAMLLNIIPTVNNTPNLSSNKQLEQKVIAGTLTDDIKTLKDDDIYRVATLPTGMWNKSLLTKVPDTISYYSLTNGRVSQFQRELEVADQNSGITLKGFDERAALYSLLSTKYIAYNRKASNGEIYGFEKTKKGNVIQNKYALPLGYTYDAYINKADYDSLTPLEKQEAILQAAVVEAPLSTVLPKAFESAVKEIDYEIKGLSDLEIKDGTVYAKGSKPSMSLYYTSLPESETYIYMTDIKEKFANTVSHPEFYKGQFSSTSLIEQQIYDFVSKPRKTTVIQFVSARNSFPEVSLPNYDFYFGRKNILANGGYSEKVNYMTTIYFPAKGEYRYDELKVLALPIKSYEEKITKLNEEVLKNISMSTNEIRGTIDVSKNKVLCMAIPYSTGWTAYVDGKAVETFPMNTMFLGAEIEAGQHDLVFKYETPGLKVGAIISGGTLFVTLITAAGYELHRYRQKKKGSQKDEKNFTH